MKETGIRITNRALFACYAVVALVGAVALFYAFIGYRADAWGLAPVVASCVVLLVAAALLVRLITRWKGSPERVFLLMAIPALLGFGLFILPDHVPDEIWHIYRVFSIEDPGSAMVVPSELIQSDMPTDYRSLFIALTSGYSWSDTTLIGRDMSTYLTHLYLVPGILVKLCMLVNVNPLIAIYLARLVNAAMFSVAGYWIVKMMPLAKVCVCVYLLNPMLIQQEASCSADAVTNIVTLLFIAYLVKVRFQDSIRARDWAILAVLFVVTSLSKFAYALLVFLFLLLVPKIESKRVRTGIYVGSAIVFVAGAVFVLGFLSSASYQSTLDLMRNPPELVAVLGRTAYEVLPMWLMQFGGMSLSNLDVVIWAPCFWAYALVLLFSLVFNFGEQRSLNRWEKVGIVALVVFVSIAIVLVFRTWTLEVDKRSDVILGVQGRYFLPYFNLLLLCLSTPRAAQIRKNCLLLYSAVIGVIYLVDMLSIIRFFA